MAVRGAALEEVTGAVHLAGDLLMARKGETHIIPEEKASQEDTSHPALIHQVRRNQAGPAARALTATAEAIPAAGEDIVLAGDSGNFLFLIFEYYF